MKMRLLLAGASALALTWATTAQAENVGVGVLEPQAVLHVSGEVGNADDVIFQNLNAYDGVANTENVLLVDEDDGQRIKTILLTDLLTDTTLSNSSFDFDTATNLLSITEGGNTLSVDLSSLSDSLSSTDTNTVITSVTYSAGVITITDSDSNSFPVDISTIDTVMINSALSFDDTTNVLSITEGATTLTVDLSDLQDSFTDTDTTIVSFDYASDTNILTILDSGLNEFNVDLSELHDTDLNLGNSDLTQTPTDTTRLYDMSGQILHFDNGYGMVGDVLDNTGNYPTLESDGQAASNHAGKGSLTTPWLYSNFIEADDGRITGTTGMALGQDGVFNTARDQITLATQGNGRLRVGGTGALRFYVYGAGTPALAGDASTDKFLTVDGGGLVREVDLPADTTIQNTSAALGTDNVLTITDEAGDVTVDLSGLAVTLSDTTVSNTAATLDSSTKVLTITDETGDVTVDLSPVDTDTNLALSDLVQTPTDTTRIYDMSGQVLHFDNGNAMIGDVTDSGGAYPLLEGNLQAASNLAGKGSLTTPWVYSKFIQSDDDRGSSPSGIAVGIDGVHNTANDQISLVTSGQSRLRLEPSGSLRFHVYGNGASTVAGDASSDLFLTVNAAGRVREVSLPADSTIQNTSAALGTDNVLTITDEAGDVTVDLSGLATTLSDTTVSNTAATLDAGTNILTITDETGDVTVDLSPVDTDTFLTFGISEQDVQPGVETTTFNYTAANGTPGQLVVTDNYTDTGASLTDNLDGSYSFQERMIQGAATTFPTVVIDTIQNTSASLDTDNVLTITDEAGDVTVDLSGLAVTLSDTTVSNTAATLDAGTNILTITDETGDVTVDLSPVDTDTTDLDWAVSSTASDLATGIADNIYTNGNVGINTDAPGYPLVVDTAATQNALVVREGTEGGLTVGRVGIGTDTPGYSLDVSGDIRATGNIYSGDQFLASNFFQTSDRRLKTDIKGFNRGLEVLRQIQTVSYRYNGMGLPSNTERLHYGVIAQDLAHVDPELVGSYYSKDDDIEYLTVNVQSMTYVLANALQQLDAENGRLVDLLMDSEMRMVAMEERLQRLEASLGVSDQ